MPFLATLPAWVGPAIGIGGAAASAIGSAVGGSEGARTQTQQQTGTQTGTMAQTITPTLSPASQALQDLLVQQYTGRLGEGLPAGFEQRGVSAINQTFQPGLAGIESMLAQRGLSGSPVAANVLGQANIRRLGEIGSFRAGIPALEEQLTSQRLRDLSALFGIMPRGQTVTGETTGTTAGSGEFVYPGSALGSGLQDIGGTLGLFAGLGLFGGDGGGSIPYRPLSQSLFS